MVSVSVSKKIGIDKSIGISFEKKLVWEKVSVSVSEKIGIEKVLVLVLENIWYKKSIGFGIEKIGIGKKFWIRFGSYFGFRHTLVVVRVDFQRHFL